MGMITIASHIYGWMLRLTCIMAVVVASLSIPVEVKCAESGTAADKLSPETGISSFRYASFGLGLYPYRRTVPNAQVRVRIDGVPLRSVSPFGSDLTLVPGGLVDSVTRSGDGGLDIATVDPAGEKTVTSIDFSQGTHRRFTFDSLYRRPIGESGGILFGGSASGIHSTEDTMKSSYRSYYLKYTGGLSIGGNAFFTSHGSRNRSGLADLDMLDDMGERKTDRFAVSLGLDEVPVGAHGNLGTSLYWQSMNSRFARYGWRRSLDDDGAGVSVQFASKMGRASYGVRLYHDAVFFDSRIHDDAWTRTVTGGDGTVSLSWGSISFALDGGAATSSKYGFGSHMGGKLSHRRSDRDELYLSVGVSEEFPDTGGEYYTSLAFSDTALVAVLDAYTVREAEIGLKAGKGPFGLSVAGFVSSSEAPVFRPSSVSLDYRVYAPYTTEFIMDGEREWRGLRCSAETAFESFVTVDASVDGVWRDGANESDMSWPWPDYDVGGVLNIRDRWYRDLIGMHAFTECNLYHFDDAGTDPGGAFLLLDCGLSINVSDIELFYVIENVTNEDIAWFNTFGWLDMNGRWGVSWRFID